MAEADQSPAGDTPPGILTPSATRALLDRLQHRPRKNLGQNFLVDGNIVRKSLGLARIEPGDRVVEIGPGLGTLTAALLHAGAEMFAIERDPVLAQHVRATLVAAYPEKLHLIEGDAVEHPLASLDPANPDSAASRFKIVANLPYAISSPWMEAVLAGPLPERMVLMLQIEAAQRYLAVPGTKSFGAISVFLQAAYRAVATHRVGRSCFHPVPEVDSTLLALERLPNPVRFSASARELIRTVFQQRRKQLAPLIKRQAPGIASAWLEFLSATNVRGDARAESIPISAWIELDRLLRASGRD